MKNALLTIMSLSILFQVMAAYLAIRWIPVSGVFIAWILLACGFAMQAVRRVISLVHLLHNQSPGDMQVELLGLAISVFMFCGIWKFGPLFREIKQAHVQMQEKQDELHESNRMLEQEAGERQKMEEILKESEERYRAVAEYSYDWDYWIDANGSFRYISPYCKEVSSYDREEFYADPQLMRTIIHPEDSAAFAQHFTTALAGEFHLAPIDFRIITRTGQIRWINHVCRPVLDSHGMPNGRRASNRDITDRKLMEQQLLVFNSGLEERVAQRTQELLRLNRELESFCYSISHELRGPLARLEAFSTVLIESVTDAKPEELTHLAERIGVSSKRLKTVIDALLQMNRLSRTTPNRETFDLSEVARRIIEDLQEGLNERIVQVTIEPGMIVQGDRSMLEVCLRNLLGNGVKYTARTTDAAIVFGRLAQEEGMVYFVRDNGAGFDMKFASKLFEPFCRLHTENEFEGNGIGLATVQRIIERHGGKVWADAAPGKGATFFFTLGA